jgi:hypothetical protein
MEPVRPSTVVVNNTTIINKTVIIEAPATTVIEKASGRKVQALPVQELRHREEAAVVARQRAPASASQQFAQTPVRSEAQPSAVKGASAPELPQAAKPVVAARTSAAPAPQKVKIESQPGKPASSPALGRREAVQPAGVNEPADQNLGKPVATARTSAAPAPQKVRIESQPGKPVSSSAQARPEAVRPAAIKEPAGQNAARVVEPPRTPPQVSENKAQRVPMVRAKHEQLASEQGRPITNKGQNEKAQEQPAKPAAPPSSQ